MMSDYDDAKVRFILVRRTKQIYLFVQASSTSKEISSGAYFSPRFSKYTKYLPLK